MNDNENFDRQELNKVDYSVRAMQAVLQYGVGAMVDFKDQTLMTAGLEYWKNEQIIQDSRFAKALGVSHFYLPTQISYVRFPQWYFCPKCRRFQPLNKWIKEYKRKAKANTLEKDPYMINHIKCPKCHTPLVVTRIVTVCENGHIDDFPWVEWVHRAASKDICVNPVLEFKTGASSSEGLDGLIVKCSSCKAQQSLRRVFNKNYFEELDEKNEVPVFKCTGKHPFRHEKGKCNCYPRVLQRGASSVYLPLSYSSLVIPPYSDIMTVKIENSEKYKRYLEDIQDEEPEDRIDFIKKRLGKWVDAIYRETGVSKGDVEKVLKHKWLEDIDTCDVESSGYKVEEYKALSGEVKSVDGGMGDFSREGMDVEDYHIPHIKSVALIDKIRVVHALVGFSRINGVVSRFSNGFVDVKGINAYPGYQVRGEGIFIEFDSAEIQKWVDGNPKIQERAKILRDNYRKSFFGENYPKKITAKFIMLHTLSHLLIYQLSFECGYNVASLSERLYCSDENDGTSMAAIFIYTASGDSEGTLGGLVRQGRPDILPKIIKKAIKRAEMCSNDPVCSMSKGQGRDALNLSACHACALLPETCCEERNVFLDRAMLVGNYEHPEIGFWSNSSYV